MVEHIEDHRYAREHGGWAVCYCVCPCGRAWVGVTPGADEESLSRPWECLGCGGMTGRAVTEAEWHRFRAGGATIVALRGLP